MKSSPTLPSPSMVNLREQLAQVRAHIESLDCEIEAAEAAAVAAAADAELYAAAAERSAALGRELRSVEAREAHLKKAFVSARETESNRLRAIIDARRGLITDQRERRRRCVHVAQVEENAKADLGSGEPDAGLSIMEDGAAALASMIDRLKADADDFDPAHVERLAELYHERTDVLVKIQDAAPPVDVRLAERIINTLQTQFRGHPDPATAEIVEGRLTFHRNRLASMEKAAGPFRERLSEINRKITALDGQR